MLILEKPRPVTASSVRTSQKKTRRADQESNRTLDSAPRIAHKKSSTIATRRSGGKQIDDLLNGVVGAVVGGFELAGRLVMGVGAVMEAAVGERAAEPFVEEEEEQRNLNPLGGQTVGIAGAVTLQQPVALEPAQVVAELVEAVGAVGEVEGGEDGVVDLLGGPAADVAAAMQEHFEQADYAGVVDLDAGIADRTDGDRQGEALQKREVDVDVEPLRLKAGEAGGDGLEALADGIEVVQSLLEAEVGEVVGDQLVAQEGGELFVLFEEGVLEVGAEDMMAVLDAIDDGGQLAAHPAVQARAEDLGDLVGGQPPQAEFAATFEQLVDGKVALEDEVAAILNLGNCVKAREIELLAFFGGELRAQDQGPVVEPAADDGWAQPVGGGLQRRPVVDGEEGIVGLAEADLRPFELLLDKAVAVEVVGGLEREERGHPHHHRAQGFVAEVEVVVCEAAALAGEDPVIWILGGVFGGADAKARPLLHALEDEVHAVGVVPDHAALPGQDMVFLAHALLGPFDRQAMIAGEGFHPGLVVGGAPAQDLFVHHRKPDHVPEEVHHLLGPRQPAEVAVNDNAVEAVVDEGQQIAEQLGEQFHGNPLQARSGSQTHQAWTGQADRRGQEFSPGR